MKSSYELRRFKNSNSQDFIEAQKLYVKYTEPAVRTDSKEIAYCLDNWHTISSDPFYVLGFYLNGRLIGFSELVYLKKENIVVVDYLIIDAGFRKNNTFYQFLEEIHRFLNNEGISYNYVVAEVACYHENLEPPESSKLLIRLLKMSHFGVVKCNYYVPRVGIEDYESAMRSIMMIYSENESRQIKKETFFQIVNAIYFKYYQPWHNLFVNEEEKVKYAQELSELVMKMTKQLRGKKNIEINGLSGLFPVVTQFDNSIKSKKVIKLLTAIVLFVFCVTINGLLFSYVKLRLGWDSDTFSAITTSAIGLTLFLVALFFEDKSQLFSKTMEKFLDKY